jgi:fructokinase
VAHLAANGVSQELLLRGPEPAALAFVSAERTDPSYTFRWDGTADRELRATDLAHAGFASLHALHFGSVALTVEPCGTAIEELVSSLAGRVFLTLDPTSGRSWSATGMATGAGSSGVRSGRSS